MIDHFVERLWARVEGGDGRIDNRALFGHAAMLRIWPRCSGVSRSISTSRRRSLRQTSAARDTRLVVVPVAISDIVLIEQGAMIMPSVLKDPLEQAAPMSCSG